jgi:hypothetical protein
VDLASVRREAEEIIALDLPIAGQLNNAGIMQTSATTNALGWDMTFTTGHRADSVLVVCDEARHRRRS